MLTLLTCSECPNGTYARYDNDRAICETCGHCVARTDVERYLDAGEYLDTTASTWGYLPAPTHPQNIWVADPHTGKPLLTARRACYACGSTDSYRDDDHDVIVIHRTHCTA